MLNKIFGNVFSIKHDTADQEEIYERLVRSSEIRGTNMCVLILAILIASIGLNMNSTAVIIGAMLISPLMGSILAMGYGVATGDLKILKRFAIGFACQVVISLLTSTIYFSLTPISDSTSELLARTSPTIWDVLIATCGGIAGTIGMTRKEKSNVIPGVAIATALMPPLCTAGYGVATGQWHYFFGAFYLFVINTYFIWFTSVLVLLVLKLPRKMELKLDQVKRKKLIHKITGWTIALIIPSLIVAYEMVKTENITGFDEVDDLQVVEVTKELEIIYPEIDSVDIGKMESLKGDTICYEMKVYLYLDGNLKESDTAKIKRLLELRYGSQVDLVLVQSEGQ